MTEEIRLVLNISLLLGADLNKSDKEGQTPLYICVQNAIVHSSYATVEMLLAAGAKVHQ